MFLKNYKYQIILLGILVISALARIWYMSQPFMVWWDSAMYIGMGKFLFSGGTIGVWESFRPPLLPIILGAVWKIGIDPLIFGKMLMLGFSLAEMYAVYRLGKFFNARIGIVAAILLSFSAVFIVFANSPLTDVPSTFFTSLALLLILEKKYASAGCSSAAAFYLRFPAGLIIVPIIMYLLITEYKTSWKKILALCAGFIVPLIPYFIINIIYFHNPLTPIIAAERVAADPVNATGYDIFFYTKNLLYENIFLIFTPLILIPLFKKDSPFWKPSLIISLSIFIVGSYFNFNNHIELRYAIAFLPFLCLAAAYGIWYLLEKIPLRFKKQSFIAAGLIVTISLIGVCSIGYENSAPYYLIDQNYLHYIYYFQAHPGATVITSNPEAIAYANMNIIQVTDTWQNTAQAYADSGTYAHYIAIDSCALRCETSSSCDVAKTSVSDYLSQMKKVSDTNYRGCSLQIYSH